MAPYVLTPTSEMDPDYLQADQVSTGSGGATSISLSSADSTSGNEVLSAPVRSTGAEINQDITDTSGSPVSSSETEYKDAYTHGYKDGYTIAHVELKHQPIAIIGMSCRLPGSVSTPDEFWELLARSRTGFSDIPPSRFSDKRFFHPNPGKSGCTNARGGNFLTQDLNAFDASFFGFTQQEALSLDHQQRILLECTFEALESAGIPKHSIVGQDVGVFVGGSLPEREVDLFRDTDTIPMHQATGCAMAMQSNRISHFFDLRGPSYTVDTACSASLVALHNACQSLRTGESSMALAAGVHLNMSPEFWISYSMSRLFGEEGRSFTFDRRGTGYGRGEGCGMILLKPLDQAIKDNDPIRAVITGTGLNQDGKTPGITMPNGSAQEALIRSIYSKGGMDPRDTGYVEAHGTGTRVGDPIEVSAIQSVFGEGRNKRKPLFIGSVKSNIGHLEAAAGIAGVIKTALMLERGFILPNYDFKYPNEKIPFDRWGLKVATRQQPWPFGKKWASVNGFGFGGTNGHVVMTRGPFERKTMKEEIDTKASEHLFVLSAHDKTSAEKTMQSLGVYLEQRPEVFQNDLMSNLAYTLGQRRSFHPWRIAVTASTSAELVETLSNGKIAPCKQDVEVLRMGWIFTGQGAQWWAMGRELYQQYPVYASAIELADAHLTLIGANFSLLQELAKDEKTTQINAAYLSQPTCTAVQLALVNLLRSWGLQSAAVVGHSSGEIAAAYAAGFITFEDAMTIAYHRGRLVPILKKMYPSLNGCMMAVGASKDQVAPLLDRICPSLGQAKIACINSTASITISGDEPAVTELQTLLEAAYPGTFARKLQVDTAYHSHHMDLVSKQYMEALQELKAPEPSEVRFYSSLLGRHIDSQELDRTYWVQNLTCPVRFDEALQGMCQPSNEHKTGVNMLCELGPHAALQGPVKQTLKYIGDAAIKIPYISALARKKNAVTTTLAMVGMLFVKGATLDMGSINFPTQDKKPQVLVDMPRYNWNHSHNFLHESRFTKVHKYHDTPRHDIIGVLAPYSNDSEPTWRNVVRLEDLPWLRQYQMQGVTMFPISGFLAMVVEAVAQKAITDKMPWDDIEVENLVVKSPIMLSEEELEMTIILKKHGDVTDSEATHSFLIQSWSQTKGWNDNCTGNVSLTSTNDNEVDGQRSRTYKLRDLYLKCADISEAATECTSASRMYTQLSKIGVVYGELFQGLEQCHASVDGAVAQIVKTDTSNEMPHRYETDYILHPAFIEQLVSLYWPIIAAAGEVNMVHLPASIGRVTVSAHALSTFQKPGSTLHAMCQPKATVSKNGSNRYDMFAVDSAGEPIITIEGLSTSPIVEHGSGAETTGPQELCYKLEWEPVPEEEGVSKQALPGYDADIIIIHGETEPQHNLAAALTQHLEATLGATVTSGTLENTAPIAQGKLCLVLTELDSPLLATLNAAQFEALKALLTTVEGAMWVVQGAYHDSTNPEANMISGFSRTLRSEGTLANFVTLDFDPQDGSQAHDFVQPIARVLHMTLGATKTVEEKEFRARGGKLFTPRVLDDGEMNAFVHEQVHPAPTEPARFCDTDRPLRASLGTPGALETLLFDDDASLQKSRPDDCVDIAVKAVGIGPTDLENRARLGMECSGIITAVGSCVPNLRVGDRVATIVPTGCLSNVARVQSKFVFRAPAHMSFEALATMPVAYCTAVYALVTQARLTEGESLLIHDAASAVGQASLTLAATMGASVWVTVKTAAEKDMIMQHYSIPQDRIWFSGAIHFAERIQSVTKGAGVDVVFNTLTDYRVLRATWASIAQFGRFVNVVGGQSTTLHVPSTTRATVHSIDIAALAAHRPSLVHRTLGDVACMMQYGQLRPLLDIASYNASEIVAALQSVTAPHSNNRSVIVFKDDDCVTAPRTKKPSSLLRKDATYILIGGTGGLGRRIAAWMVSKGAQHLVLLSRSGSVHGAAAQELEDLRTLGANIFVRSCDVSSRSAVEALIQHNLSSLPPIRGVIHSAMVLDDVLFESMTHAQYTAVVTSKLHGARNFQTALSSPPNPSDSNLDFFVLISSAAGTVGNRGQAAYAAANTFLDGFAQHLRARGVNACSLDLTAVSDAGYLAGDAAKAAEVMRNLGSDTICISQVLALVHAGIAGKLGSCGGHPVTGMRIGADKGGRPFWQHDAKFTHLVAAADAANTLPGGGEAALVVPWSTRFRAAGSRDEARSIVTAALVEKIAEVVSMEQGELDMERNLSAYALDSLTAIEVRNFITRIFESNLQVLELLASGSIRTLAGVVVGKTKVVLPA